MVLELPQDPAHVRVDNPGFCAKKHHRLEHGFKENPDTCGVSPYLLRILVNRGHTACAFARILTTAGQSLSADDIKCPNYLKKVTISRGRPYALKALGVTSLSSFAAKRLLFHPAPFLHCAVRRCIPCRS